MPRQWCCASPKPAARTSSYQAIVIAELYYLTVRQDFHLTPTQILADLDQLPGCSVPFLGRRQLEQLERLESIPEMHDRLIAADAVVHQAIVVTRDRAIQASGLVTTLW